MSRIIDIWKERVVYDFNFIDVLSNLLNAPFQKLKLADPVQEFQVMNLLLIYFS